MAARRQHQESQQDVLCLEGPPGDGPNIGQAYNAFDTLYSWNGDVVNMKANGYGIWCRRFARFYGKMVDGAIEGSYVVKYFSGAMKFFCNDGTLTETAYDRNNPIHKDIVDMAQARADIAHARVTIQLNSFHKSINHFHKVALRKRNIKTYETKLLFLCFVHQL
eukprot:m.104741 g.104741  ORF g.104741 m.104741 type:complete len:164 (-) comp13854_c0_seq2:607-1098(-)